MASFPRCAHRHRQVDDQPHDPGRRRRGTDQDGAGAAPPGAAADAELRGAQPGARARAHALLHQHRNPPLDPRRPGPRGGPASTPSASAASTPTRYSRNGVWSRPPSTRRPGTASSSSSRPALGGELRERAQELLAALADGACPALEDLAYTLSRRVGELAEPRRLAIVAGSLDDLREKLTQAAERLGDPACERIKTTSGIYFEAHAARARGQGRLRVPRRGRPVPGDARRAVHALSRGTRRLRPHRRALRRASARASAQRLGLPAAVLLRCRSGLGGRPA